MSNIELAQRQEFMQYVEKGARAVLQKVMGTEDGQARAAQFGIAFRAAAEKSPQLYNCSQNSVAQALSICLLANLTPGGAHPQVWLLPKGGALQTWIAPHGYRELARRAGVFLQEVPVWAGEEDRAQERIQKVAEGGVYVPVPDPRARELADLVGFYIIVRDSVGTRIEWLGAEDIDKRRRAATTDKVWKAWGPEMARKSALKWAFNRAGRAEAAAAEAHAPRCVHRLARRRHRRRSDGPGPVRARCLPRRVRPNRRIPLPRRDRRRVARGGGYLARGCD
jgi:hypothetical protein